jgi:hypothetical protein
MLDNNDTTSTTEETVETVETSETEPTVEATEEVEYMTIDDLLGLSDTDDELFGDEVNHKGMKPLHEWMGHLPEDVRKHLANIRSSTTRKQQEIAQQRKELEALRQELIETKSNTMNNKVLEEFSKYNTDEQHDIYSEQGMQAEIKRQAALMMQEMMRPAQEKIALERRQLELNNFKSQNPELTSDEYRVPIAEMLRDRPELSLEDAFYIVKAKVDSKKLQQEREAYKNDKSQRRQSFSKTSTGGTSAPKGPPKSRDAWEIYKWHRDNGAK